MCQVTSIRYEMHKLITSNSSWKTFTMMLPPHWLWCLFASALPGSIWKSEMLEACLEKPVFRVFAEQDYQQDQVDIENISRLVSSIREWQIGSTEMVLGSHRFIYWDEMPSLEAISNKCVCSAVDRASWCQRFCVGFPPQVARCWSQPCAASSCSLGTASRRWSAGSASSAGPASPPGTPWMSSPWSSTPPTKGAQHIPPFTLHPLPGSQWKKLP